MVTIPHTRSLHIHPIDSNCLLGWTTPMSPRLLSERPRRFIVRRILLLFSRAWKVRSCDSIDSGCFEALACHEWSLYVGRHRFPPCCATQPSLSSWEFFTTLDYEWRVIRGRLPYRWTIWVRNNRSFTWLFAMHCVWANLFIR